MDNMGLLDYNRARNTPPKIHGMQTPYKNRERERFNQSFIKSACGSTEKIINIG